MKGKANALNALMFTAKELHGIVLQSNGIVGLAGAAAWRNQEVELHLTAKAQ